MGEVEEETMEGEVMEGVASIALLPNGSISGHFIQMPQSISFGLHGIGEVEEETMEGEVMEGVASIALLPNGSISGHFIQMPQSISFGLHGIELACERECSRGEDYRLIKLTVTDFNSKVDKDVVVECKGHDAARFHNIDHLHGWENDVTGLVEEKHKKEKIKVSFECETLKADEAAEEHIKQFMPKLAGMDAVVNVGKMRIVGLNFGGEVENECSHKDTLGVFQ